MLNFCGLPIERYLAVDATPALAVAITYQRGMTTGAAELPGVFYRVAASRAFTGATG
ncbi:hypothetical protein [Neomoorella thermoacetica]|uniref:hypothetical protein n=1 Tax=Neomoorella thermoacetica TaxID=1525 RepID=UPI0004B81163|nr:hypothetical protein [Moorella thermoacetica]OIQ12857.1 hypothetical protein MOOTH_02430 [Moorella thermoacetica]